jgi:hypothetical protein
MNHVREASRRDRDEGHEGRRKKKKEGVKLGNVYSPFKFNLDF